MSEDYFNSRPVPSRVAAVVSAQSRPLGNMQQFEAQITALDKEVCSLLVLLCLSSFHIISELPYVYAFIFPFLWLTCTYRLNQHLRQGRRTGEAGA